MLIVQLIHEQFIKFEGTKRNMVAKNKKDKWRGILVHGTFARNAAWTKEDSILRLKLENHFGKENITFDAFQWPGNNQFMLRRRESKRLSNRIKKLLSKYNENLILLCHSHGGNIAVDAIKNNSTDNDRINIVLFNTPYIYFLQRDGGRAISSFLLSILVFSSLLTIYSLIEAFDSGWDRLLQSSTSIALLFFSGIIFSIFLALFLFRKKIRSIGEGWSKRAEKFTRSSKIANARLLSINTAGDEVFNFFNLLETIAGLPYIFLNKKVLGIITLVSSAFFIYYIVSICSKNLQNEFLFNEFCRIGNPSETLQYFVRILLILSLVYVVFILFLSVLSIFLNGILCLFLGINPIVGPIALFFHRIGVSMLQASAIHQEFKDAGVSGAAINHSVAYSDAATIDYIIKWMENDESRLRA